MQTMWEYAEASRLMTLGNVTSTECIFCQTPLYRFPAKKFDLEERRLLAQVSICLTCGWWTVYRVHQGDLPHSREAESYSGSMGCLKELDLSDSSLPLREIRQYLAARKDKLFEVDPKALEDIVGSIYTDFGYKVRVTGQRVPGDEGDDGIDVILDSSNGTIGIQVKRFKKDLRIEAEQIRALAGALMLGEHTRGVFVTTSEFRRGARQTAERFGALGLPIELINAKRLFEALGIAQLKTASITAERINSYILSSGAHVGSGITKEFVEGENLLDRPVVATIFLRDELLEISDGEKVDDALDAD
jgi:restriction system protein